MPSALEGYETAKEAAERYGIDDSQVRRYCAQGRIRGAVKVGHQWLVPVDSWPEEAGPGPGRPPEWAKVRAASSPD